MHFKSSCRKMCRPALNRRPDHHGNRVGLDGTWIQHGSAGDGRYRVGLGLFTAVRCNKNPVNGEGYVELTGYAGAIDAPL